MSIWLQLSSLARKAFEPDDETGTEVAALTRAPDPGDVEFTAAIIGLSAKLAKADGLVTTDEVAAFARVFTVAPEDRASMQRVFNIARQTVLGYESYARRIAKRYRDRPCLLEGVLDGLRTYASCSGVPRRLPMRPIIACVVRLFRWHMQQKGVALSTTIEGEPEAWGTTAEICQVLLNLLANAAEASPRGSTVALTCSATHDEVTVRVDDDGPGIEPGDSERVFEPFRSTKDDGFGLGLTVARAMARRHGGDLVVTTPRRRGASFELKLPRLPR